MGAGIALTLGGVISFLLNFVGFLPLLINKIDPVIGTHLKDSLISLLAKIPHEQVAASLVALVSAIPSTMMLGFAMWVAIALLIAGFISIVKGLKGWVIGGIIAGLIVLYLTGQLVPLT